MNRAIAFSRSVTATGLLAAALILPIRVEGHGELLIRINALTRQIQTATNDVGRLYLKRAELYREDRNWDAAVADLNKAELLLPASGAVELVRAEIWIDRREFQTARKSLDELLRLNPSNGRAMLLRGHVLAELKKRAAAIADFESGVKVDIEANPSAFLEWAGLLEADGRMDEALRSLDAGIKKFGPINELQVPAIELELKRGNHAAALARVDTILERAERKEHWYVRKGDIQLLAGMKEEAAHAYEEAMQAIKRLPPQLQQNPPMQKVMAHIRSAQEQIRGVASR